MIDIVEYDPKYNTRLLALARDIHAASIHADLPLDEEKLLKQLAMSGNLAPDRWFRIAVDHLTGEVLGAFYGCVTRLFFSDEKCAKDIGQWCRRDGRSRNAHAVLVGAFEDWARSQGAKKVALGYSLAEADNIEVMRRLAEFHGYKVLGYNTMKEL